jgi:dipeptidyl aminopeptidase/acylaminoacyl peptidase
MLQGQSGLWTIDPTTGASAELGLWQAASEGLSSSADKRQIVQVISDLDGFMGLAVIDAQTGDRTMLWNEAEDFFRESPAAQWEAISVDRGGTTIHGWLLKPADFDERKAYPLIIDIHGGPHGAYSYGFNMFCEMPATNGFLVLYANPRGSTSYGREFAEGCIQDWGGGDWEDLQAILDPVVARPYVDADRTGVYGYSYGGFMTSWIIGHTDRFKAALCGAPVYDLASFYGSSDVGYAFLDKQIGGLPWSDKANYAKHSPSTYIQNAKTPTLIVCGEADERCPISQAEQMYMALSQLGVDTEFARYPGGAHGFLITAPPAHRLDFLQRYLAWFKKYLGDPA